MPIRATASADKAAPEIQVFHSVLVGVDGSTTSVEATRRAALLTEPDGTLALLAAWTMPPPRLEPDATVTLLAGSAGPPATFGVVGPTSDSEYARAGMYRETSERAVASAKRAIGGITAPATKVVRGIAWEALMEEIAAERPTLVVVGSDRKGRTRRILRPSTTTEVVHKAPCSVLVARAAGDQFPRLVAVGIDGSSESAAAFAVARHLADRFGSELRPVVAHGGKGVDEKRVTSIVEGDREDVRDGPVGALVAASNDADLVVVGSRGLHGFRALGSVSERVAHHAHCSLLIVREPPWACIGSDIAGNGTVTRT